MKTPARIISVYRLAFSYFSNMEGIALFFNSHFDSVQSMWAIDEKQSIPRRKYLTEQRLVCIRNLQSFKHLTEHPVGRQAR